VVLEFVRNSLGQEGFRGKIARMVQEYDGDRVSEELKQLIEQNKII
jgi:hypothetical protein